ncbi:Ig-like domain-containing protein, partial [Flavobacterium sp. LS1P3]|uniref:Ig-like domain-containing protein n=1 Tax=Flavobacterium sp. LS1P3 TaxID=3401720 RepID=UPI003AAF7E74
MYNFTKRCFQKYSLFNFRLFFVFFLLLLGNSTKIFSQTVQEYNTAGTFTFVLPAGTTSATVEVWGAGGGAGASTATNGGGGGGGGAYARTVFTNPTAGNYTVVVGAAGTAGSGSNAGGVGGNSYLGSTTNIFAQGGRGGAVGGAGGAGGTVAATIGTFRFAGGTGGVGGGTGGGGGGSSAGSAANGTNGGGNAGAGGIAPANGGNGGNGTGSTGVTGFFPGGGGGGSNDISGTAGAAGAVGRVVITYTCAVGPVVFTSGTSSTRCQASGVTTYAATSANSTSISYTLDATSLAAGNTINAATGEVTFTAAWVGSSTVTANAVSPGCTGATATHTITTSALAGPPVFALGSASQRCAGAGNVTYSATAPNSTNIVYTLDATSLAAGNTINAATGQVTYTASYTGNSVITATSNGCGSPSASHTVSVITSVNTPVFLLGNSSERCRGAGTATYTATSSNATSISYSLDNLSLVGGNTINSATGEVTFAALYTGSLTITATATACGFTATATHTISNTSVIAVNDSYTTTQGTPVAFNVLTNDLCNVDPTSVSIVTEPEGGLLQVGANGQITYVSFGSFFGTDTFTYQVCSTFPVTCKTATVTVEVAQLLDDPCSEANKSKTFYLPFPENDTQLRQSLISAASANNLTAQARSIVSFAVPYPKTVIFYDHWEDGYEVSIDSPVQPSTLVWGDGILTNGTAPGYPTDIIPPGGVITIDSNFPWNRPTSTVVFDGKDKVFSTANISVVKVSGDNGLVGATPLFNVQNVKTNVADTSRFGQFFVLPFGENVTAGPTGSFKYTGLFVRAQENGTIVQLDYNGDGTNDVTSPTLNQGEVWFYNGTARTPGNETAPTDVNNANDIKAGARVSANKNVGLDLLFGGIDTYGTRNIPILPSQFYGSTYYSPVYSTDTTTPTPVYIYFVNPNPDPITINWTRSGTAPLSGTITVPGDNGINFYNANTASATKFVSAGSESYTAVGIVDADPAGTGFDWAYNLIPESRLSSFVNLAWAPGSSDGSANYSPVWITPTANTTIYVKYDGNVSTGPNQSPCGAFYDVSFTVNQLQSQLILDPDRDNTGMAIYNCNEVPMAAVWGQRPFGGTPAGSPALDVGYTIEPKCLSELVFATDDRRVTAPTTPININVANNDAAFLATLNPLSVLLISQPANGLAVLNPDGTVTYTPNAGFVGTDSFNYQICATSPDQGVCDIATVYISTVAPVVAGQNTVCGTVYLDSNINGQSNPGETGLGNINVQLYEDLDKNSVISAGDNLIQTVASSNTGNLGFYQFNINQDFRQRDEFTTPGSATGSNGTLNWATDWTKIVDAGAFNANNIRVVAAGLQIQGNGATTQAGALRSANIANASSAVLTYTYDKTAFNSATTDFVEVQVASSTAGPWTTLTTYNTTAVATGSEAFTIPTGLISSTTSIRFRESNNATFATTERVIFDNVQIQSYYDRNYIVQLQTPIANGYSQTSTPVAYPIAFVGVNNSDCDNSFGLYQYAPVANNDDQSASPLAEDGANGTVNVLTNDTDLTGNPTAPVNGSGQFTIDLNTTSSGVQSILTNAQGVWTLNPATGEVTFDPANNFNGTATLTYELCDPSALCDTALITFVVSPVNDAPIANDDNESANPLSEDDINGIVNLLTNDTDVEGNPSGPLNGVGQFSVDLDTATAGVQDSFTNAQGVWTLDINTGDLVFDPATNFNGTATLTYNLCDPAGLCDTALITFVVTAVNDAPVANDDDQSATPLTEDGAN